MAANTEIFRERTRATRYQPRHQLPPNFSAILKEYTREILRDQPENILAWSAQYFKKLALETDPMLAQQPPPEHYLPAVENPEAEVVSLKIAKVFAQMDDKDTGRLYVRLVKRALLEAFGLSRPQSIYILSSDYVQLGDDSTMEYRRFARDCVNAVMYFQETNYNFAPPQTLKAVHGLSATELSQELIRIYRAADPEGLGRLRPAEFRSALMKAPLQLTRRDIAVLCAEAEQTSDGFVDYKTEVGKAFDLLCLSHTFTEFDEHQTQ